MKKKSKFVNRSTYDKLMSAHDVAPNRIPSVWVKQFERALMRMGWSQQWITLQVGYIANGSKDGRGRGPWHQYKYTKRKYVLRLIALYLTYRDTRRKGYLAPIDLEDKLKGDKTLAQLKRFVQLNRQS
jgi:hypothetical protein